MNLWKEQTLLLAWLLSIISNNVDDGSGQGSVISCKAKEAPAGGTASLTCYFNIDVQQAQRNLIVKKFIPGQTEDPPETVSYCYWSGGEPQCTNKDFIKCEIANSHMKVKFMKAPHDWEGVYRCEFFPSDNTLVHSCRFESADTPSTQQPSEYTTPTEETSNTTATENCENLEAKDSLIKCLIAVIGVLLVVIAALIVLFKIRFVCLKCLSC
ncbi:uncharacterized protein [Littorina saxatilis]|uniref:uncharacterized protein n=1 Tax=Littorina saxatilis TaxID=31220 RepID=UPI0038B4E7EA